MTKCKFIEITCMRRKKLSKKLQFGAVADINMAKKVVEIQLFSL